MPRSLVYESEEIEEDDCPVCMHYDAADRPSMRAFIDSIPLKEEVCEACELAFWRNIAPDLFGPPKNAPSLSQ